MGCLFALIAVLSPRFAVFLLWAFTNYVDRAFNGWFLPLLGIVFAPWTTLMYVLVYAPAAPLRYGGSERRSASRERTRSGRSPRSRAGKSHTSGWRAWRAHRPIRPP